MKPIHVFDVWHIKEGCMNGTLRLLSEIAKSTREEKGNLFFSVHQINEATNTIVLFEAYSDLAAMEEHLESPHLQVLFIGGILPWLEKRDLTIMSEISDDGFPADPDNLSFFQ